MAKMAGTVLSYGNGSTRSFGDGARVAQRVSETHFFLPRLSVPHGYASHNLETGWPANVGTSPVLSTASSSGAGELGHCPASNYDYGATGESGGGTYITYITYYVFKGWRKAEGQDNRI